MNPFKRFYIYFTAKSVKQRIGVIIAFALLMNFVVFFIKGNFFDNRSRTYENSQTSVSDTSQSEENADGNSEVSQGNDIKFHISVIDMVILLVVIAFFVIHKIREKQKHRRM